MALEKALESGDFVTGQTTGKVKGGLTVLVNGIRAFLPGSLIDTRPIKDLTPYENKTMEFKVVKINHEYKNVVVSHKALIQDELEKQKAEIISKLEDPPTDLVRRDSTWKKLGLTEDDAQSVDQIVELLVRHKTLLQRPIVVTDTAAIVGRPKERIRELLSR
jgi:arsenate reductase-like glutaredoxin family protein